MRKNIPTGLNYSDLGLEIPFSEVSRRFEETEYGQNLKNNVRWEPMKTAAVSNSEWRKLLGADVDNFHHMALTDGLTRVFLDKISHEGLSEVDLEVLRLTAKTHDWAEGHPKVGDIPYDKKTNQDEDLEQVILAQMLAKYLPEDACSNDPRVPKVLATIFDRESKLWNMFHIIEIIGYVRTGLNAFERRHRYDGEQHERLTFMGKKVVANHLGVVFDNSTQYPVLGRYLQAKKPLCERIIADTKEGDFRKFAPNKEEACLIALEEVRQKFAKLGEF